MRIFRHDSFDKEAYEVRLESINDGNWIGSSCNRGPLENESDVCVPKGIERERRNLFSPVSETHFGIQWESAFSRDFNRRDFRL